MHKIILVYVIAGLMIGCKDYNGPLNSGSYMNRGNQPPGTVSPPPGNNSGGTVSPNSGASNQLPATGSSYSDPSFNTSTMRVSNATGSSDMAGGGTLTHIIPEYSTMSPFNSDTSRLLLQHFSYFALYDSNGNFIKDLPFEINASSEPRWSRNNPNIFYFINGNRFKRHDISSGVSTVLHAFSEYSRISGHGESDISFDGDHFVLAGDRNEIFVYTLSSNRKGPVLDVPGTGGFDNLQITPNNNVLVGWLQAGPNRFNGYELFDQNMNFIRQAATVLGHSDVARDINGNDVLLWANAAEPNAPSNCQNGIVKINLVNGQRTCLITFVWSLASHISVADMRDWFIISTYAYNDPGPESSWPMFTNEILQVKLDGTEVRRLAHHGSQALNNYYYQPHASVSRDGSRLVFASNQGLSSTQGFPTDYADTYLLSLSGFSSGVSAPVIGPIPILDPILDPIIDPLPDTGDIIGELSSVDVPDPGSVL